MFPRGWIDVNAVAGEPGQNLWFRGHGVEWELGFGGMQEGNCLAAGEIGLCWERARADPSDFPEPRGLSAMVGCDLRDHSRAHVFVDCGEAAQVDALRDSHTGDDRSGRRRRLLVVGAELRPSLALEGAFTCQGSGGGVNPF